MNDDSSLEVSKPYKCVFEGCNASFSRPYRLEGHICTHTGELPFKCKYADCLRAYTSSYQLKRHIKRNHAIKMEYEEIFKCPYEKCNNIYQSKNSVVHHIKRSHDSSFICKICNMSFPKHKFLTSHMFLHTGVMPYNCKKCPSTFPRLADLNKHMRGHREYSCDFGCSDVFCRWTDLRRHYKLFHPRILTCSSCEKQFYNKSTLRTHMKVHAEQPDEVFICPFINCARSYSYRKNLAFHIRTFHTKTKYQCPECSVLLSTPGTLTRHMQYHAGKINQPKKPKASKRKKRKDADVPKRSAAVKLSGLQLSYRKEKALLKGATITSSTDEGETDDQQSLQTFKIPCAQNAPSNSQNVSKERSQIVKQELSTIPCGQESPSNSQYVSKERSLIVKQEFSTIPCGQESPFNSQNVSEESWSQVVKKEFPILCKAFESDDASHCSTESYDTEASEDTEAYSSSEDSCVEDFRHKVHYPVTPWRFINFMTIGMELVKPSLVLPPSVESEDSGDE